MLPQTTTQISRPLPPSRPIPPTPPRGTIYVVERFGRFSRLLPGNGPPLLPLVDRVIAAYARRVDQVTPPEGLLLLLSSKIRVALNAKWSIRVSDARKLAYRISDVDRCVDLLVHVRIRDTLSTVPLTTDLDDPTILKRISEAIRAAIESTASRFGVACPHFKILSLRFAEEKPQRSLNLAEVSSVQDYYANGIETVLPELPREPAPTAAQSFSSLPFLPPPNPKPNSINYPQPIAYPQPPQPPRRPPALASVRLPPPLTPPTAANPQQQLSDDESPYRLQHSPKLHQQSHSYRELPATSSSEHQAAEPLKPRRMYARSRSLPQLQVSDEEVPDWNQPSSDVEAHASSALHSSEEEQLKSLKPVSETQTNENPFGALVVSEDEVVRPVPLTPTHANIQELPRDISSLTEDMAPPSVPQKREVLYAPPPSPTISNKSTKSTSVLPELLSNALETDIKKSNLGFNEASRSSSPEPASPPPDRASPPPERASPPERESPPPERASSPPERTSAHPQRVSPLQERVLPPPPQRIVSSQEHTSPSLEGALPPLEGTLPPEGALRPPEGTSPPPGRVSPISTYQEAALLRPEPVSSPAERVSPPRERVTPVPQQAPPRRALPPWNSPPRPQGQVSVLPERSSSVTQRTSPSPPASPSDAFSPPLASIFTAVAPTPHSELPSSERSSDSPSDSQEGPLASSPTGSSKGPKNIDLSQGLASESSDDSYKDAVNEPIPPPLTLVPAISPADPDKRGGESSHMSRTAQAGSTQEAPQASQGSLASTTFPMGPLLGPPMIPMPMETARGPHRVPISAFPHLGSQTANSDVMSQTRPLRSIPRRAPTPPMMPPSTSVREATSGHVASDLQHRAEANWQFNPVVAAEGLGPNPTDPARPLPLDVTRTHPAEVDNRAKHAIPRGAQPLFNRGADSGQARNDDSGYSSTEAVHEKDVRSESDDANTGTRGEPLNVPPLRREPRTRRQHVQTASLFSSVVGKAERAIKSAGASLASELIDGPMSMIQTPSNTSRIAGGVQRTATRATRVGPPTAGQQVKPGTIREAVHGSEAEASRQVPDMPHSTRVDPEALRDKEVQRRGPERMRDEAHPRRDGKRLRTTEEAENLSRKERARRERLMDGDEKIQRGVAVGGQSSDDDSTRMMVDEGSDAERERFNDEVMSHSGAHLRRRREKPRHRRRHTSREDDVYDSDDSSSEEACADCGHHHHHDGHGSSSHRKGRSKSRSRRSEGSHHERSDYDSEPRSRSGRERKGTSEASVDSHRSGRSSSRERHHSKKTSSRDRKIEKSSSSGRSRSRDEKRSHSKSRSSSRKRDGEDKKRKESKSKSKSRKKRTGPTPEQLDYKPMETELRSIYRHRLPESDSGPENPIPWYCEGESQPEDTDLDDYQGPDSSDSDGRKRSKPKTTVYSSYGKRDRYGRRHRAHHNRSVTFLYDNRR